MNIRFALLKLLIILKINERYSTIKWKIFTQLFHICPSHASGTILSSLVLLCRMHGYFLLQGRVSIGKLAKFNCSCDVP